MIATIRDITDLKGTEDALRESERRLSDALKLTQARVVQLDAQQLPLAALQRPPHLLLEPS